MDDLSLRILGSCADPCGICRPCSDLVACRRRGRMVSQTFGVSLHEEGGICIRTMAGRLLREATPLLHCSLLSCVSRLSLMSSWFTPTLREGFDHSRRRDVSSPAAVISAARGLGGGDHPEIRTPARRPRSSSSSCGVRWRLFRVRVCTRRMFRAEGCSSWLWLCVKTCSDSFPSGLLLSCAAPSDSLTRTMVYVLLERDNPVLPQKVLAPRGATPFEIYLYLVKC